MHLMVLDVLATAVALRIGGNKLQPLLKEMKNNLRSKRYAKRHKTVIKKYSIFCELVTQQFQHF
jgi:hypothetical protein